MLMKFRDYLVTHSHQRKLEANIYELKNHTGLQRAFSRILVFEDPSRTQRRSEEEVCFLPQCVLFHEEGEGMS